MKPHFRLGAVIALWGLATPFGRAQGVPAERSFPQAKPVVEAALRQLQATSGRLPTLDGFAVPAGQPLELFQKGYYQCTLQVSATPSGGSVVRVRAKITAWYNAPVAAKSGYQVLPSNGRLESDLLDRLAEALSAKTISAPARASSATDRGTGPSNSSAPVSNLPSAPSSKGNRFPRSSSSLPLPPRSTAVDRHSEDLASEATSLEEILRNQSHPDNLAAVRKSATPVLVSPSEGAKVLFLAEAEDEFEILDSNESWVHVRISGLSRAWIRRSSLEMPGSSIPENTPAEPPSPSPVASGKAPFQIENEQTAAFPGDWQPLRGKVVRIVSLRASADNAGDSGSQTKLEFVKALFAKKYAELTQSSSTAAGIVLIFDSSDGGMVAATLPVLQEWKAGTLSEEGLWRRCYVDPPEMFRSAGGGSAANR